MNNNVKILIGAAVGGGIGWFIGAVIAEYLVAKAEMEERGDYHDSDEFPQDGEDANNPVMLKEQEMGKQSKKKNSERDYTKHFAGNKVDSLQALGKKYGIEGADKIGSMEPTVMFEDELADMPEGPDADPAIISMHEFYANDEQFEVIQLEFYEGDDVVVDENDEPIDKVTDILGDEALLSFGVDSEDENVVYVRNRSLRAVYEVTRLNKTYSVVPDEEETVEPIRRRSPLSKMQRLTEDENGSTDGTT